MFTLGPGGRNDAHLHNPILAEGDESAAKAVTIARLKKRGWPDDEIAAFLGAGK